MSEWIKKCSQWSFFRFLLVGAINTLVGYSVTLILHYILGVDYRLAQVLNFLICFPLAYTLQSLYAFRTTLSWKKLLIYPLSSLPNLLAQVLTTVVVVQFFNAPKFIAYIFSYIVPIPIMYFVVKFLVSDPKPKGEVKY